jgi:hypothetical protein
MLRCGKSLILMILVKMLHCTRRCALPRTGRFCIVGDLLSACENSTPTAGKQHLPTAGMAEVKAGSPWETATRQGSTPVEVLAVQKALRQVGLLEPEARGAA